MEQDTIAAISTAASPAGIGIIRISGENAVEIASRIFRPNKSGKDIRKEKSHTIHYGTIWENGQYLDEVILLLMKGPNSFTKEDTVEIDCHGGIYVTKRILEAALHEGARPAEPGEFTKRAFLNGRMDLSQAEAVIDMIHSQNEYALKASISQLKGEVSAKITELRESILYHIAFIESALDDPEHISLDGYAVELNGKLHKIVKNCKTMIDSFENGKRRTEGIQTVIIGKPNAGKSSILNLVLGEEKAIVTDIEGTTRDAVEDIVHLNGIQLNLVDTAGIRDTQDIVERIGVDKAKQLLKKGDLILFVVDSSRKIDENDRIIMELLKEKHVIVLMNKSDLESIVSEQEIKKWIQAPIVWMSAKRQDGLKELEKTITELFFQGELLYNNEVMITNIRHKNLLEEAYQSLLLVIESIESGMPEDFYSIDLMNAYESLGKILGEAVEEDLVNEIFSKFCTGK